MQKHALVEADIGIQAERVRGVNASAQKFATDGEGKVGRSRYYPPSPELRLGRSREVVCTLTFLCQGRFPVGLSASLSWAHEIPWGGLLSSLTLSCFSHMHMSFP